MEVSSQLLRLQDILVRAGYKLRIEEQIDGEISRPILIPDKKSLFKAVYIEADPKFDSPSYFRVEGSRYLRDVEPDWLFEHIDELIRIEKVLPEAKLIGPSTQNVAERSVDSMKWKIDDGYIVYDTHQEEIRITTPDLHTEVIVPLEHLQHMVQINSAINTYWKHAYSEWIGKVKEELETHGFKIKNLEFAVKRYCNADNEHQVLEISAASSLSKLMFMDGSMVYTSNGHSDGIEYKADYDAVEGFVKWSQTNGKELMTKLPTFTSVSVELRKKSEPLVLEKLAAMETEIELF